MNSSPSSWRITGFVIGLTLGAACMGVGSLLLDSTIRWEAVVVLSLLGALGANLRERELADHVGVSFITVVVAAAMVLAGPAGAVLVGYLSFLFDFRHSTLRSHMFNPAMTAVLAGTGSIVYLTCNGRLPVSSDLSPTELLTHVALPLLAAYLVSIAANAVLLAVMLHLTQGEVILRVAVNVVRSLGPGYLVHVLLALLLVLLWEPAGMGAFSAVLIVVPLLLTQWAISRDAEERRSHSRTVSTLMGALEVATPYSIGHSARVAELTDRMAPRLGITGDSADALHFAALLHDLGLVSTSPQVPKGTVPSDVGYLAAIQEHPEAGVHMLSDIEFLAPAMPGILHHHERFDGLGYPAGLSGSDIHIFARVIAVADAFDSLTTNRSYRPESSSQEALDECWKRAGTHLDPDVVQALAEALADRPWEPTRISDEMLATAADVNDHDDPSVSDEYAAWQPEVDEVRT